MKSIRAQPFGILLVYGLIFFFDLRLIAMNT
jgi:hypothetical protein